MPVHYVEQLLAGIPLGNHSKEATSGRKIVMEQFWLLRNPAAGSPQRSWSLAPLRLLDIEVKMAVDIQMPVACWPDAGKIAVVDGIAFASRVVARSA